MAHDACGIYFDPKREGELSAAESVKAFKMALDTLYLIDSNAFDELESSLTDPAKPTESILKGAELLRHLYKKS